MIRRLIHQAIAVLCLTAASRTALADNYPRQRGIDAVHYAFRIEIGDRSSEVVGEAAVELRFIEASQKSFWLDLASPTAQTGMTASSVEWDGKPLAFSQTADRLVVTLPDAPAAGDRRTFKIRYRGAPAAGLRVLPNKYRARVFFVENWPDKARQWLPVIDHPSDKATSEFTVIAPPAYKVVANGLLVDEADLNDGRHSTHWRQSVPIPVWQTVFAAGPFVRKIGAKEHGIPIETWTYPEDIDKAPAFEDASRRVLAFFSDRFGPYPYEKLGSVEAVSPFGGMENAAAIFYTEKVFNGSDVVPLVAHEVAHQWFGSSVTESDWNDVWLSEGFATYASLLFIEHERGREAFVAGLQRGRDTVFRAEAADPGSTVVHANLTDMNHVIGPHIYQKGAWTLHMLRGIIAEDAFWAGLKAFHGKYRDGIATTDDFRATMETVSRQPLGWFFDQWLKRPGTPILRVAWSFDPKAKKVLLDLKQLQPGEPYRLPLEIGLTESAEGRSKIRVEPIILTTSTQRFAIEAEVKPASISLDPNLKVLFHLDPSP